MKWWVNTPLIVQLAVIGWLEVQLTINCTKGNQSESSNPPRNYDFLRAGDHVLHSIEGIVL